MKIFVAGTFDHFHVGHQWLLWQGALMGDCMVVTVARDKTVEHIKNHRPDFLEDQRLKRLEEEGLPNTEVRLGREDADFLETLREESPDLVLLGYDQGCPKSIEEEYKVIRCSEYHPEVFKSSYFR